MRGQIHVFTIRSLSASVTLDDDGFETRGAPTDVEIDGFVGLAGADEVRSLGQVAQSTVVACHAPLGTAVTDDDLIVVSSPTELAGTYQVVAVRPQRKALRILASRYTAQD